MTLEHVLFSSKAKAGQQRHPMREIVDVKADGPYQARSRLHWPFASRMRV